MKTRVTYIISDINKALAFEWVNDYLDKDKFDLSFILINKEDSELEKYLKAKGTRVYRVVHKGKKSFFSTFLKIRKILKKEKTQVVHTHLFLASFIGLMAAKSVGVKKRIHTRHHSSFHHVYFPRAVFYDKIVNRLATHIIAISENVANILREKEKVKDKKITLVHHGFQLEGFDKKNISQKNIDILAKKYNTKDKSPVIGVIARYIVWKGIQHIIPAFEKLLEKYPNAHLVLANARGAYKASVSKLLEQHLKPETYTEISFENDLFALYQLFDVYVHTPIDNHSEAFGQTYVEALAAGIPSVFTLSGISREFIAHEKNALVVPFEDTEALYQAMIRVVEEPGLKQNLASQGKKDVLEKFTLQGMIDKLEKLYTLTK